MLELDSQHAKAHRLLGRCYYEAKGVLHDLRRTGEHLEVARRGGLADAATDLGALYEEHGQVAEAMALFEEGRQGGDPRAANNFGFLHEQQGRLAVAKALYEEGRQGGDADAATNLGALYAT